MYQTAARISDVIEEGGVMKIQDVAARTKLSIHTLRYYEGLGLIVPVARAGNGHRIYSEYDVERIVFVSRLRAMGMPITTIQRYMQLAQQGDATVTERLQILERHEVVVMQHLQEFQNHLALIRRKIAHYRELFHANLMAEDDVEEPTAPIGTVET